MNPASGVAPSMSVTQPNTLSCKLWISLSKNILASIKEKEERRETEREGEREEGRKEGREGGREGGRRGEEREGRSEQGRNRKEIKKQSLCLCMGIIITECQHGEPRCPGEDTGALRLLSYPRSDMVLASGTELLCPHLPHQLSAWPTVPHCFLESSLLLN